jgi:hypothetical protein
VPATVIDILEAPWPVITTVLPDGSAFLTTADLLTALGALADAAEFITTGNAAGYAALDRSLLGLGETPLTYGGVR